LQSFLTKYAASKVSHPCETAFIEQHQQVPTFSLSYTQYSVIADLYHKTIILLALYPVHCSVGCSLQCKIQVYWRYKPAFLSWWGW